MLSAQDTGSFLAITLGLVLVKIKRNFDRFMEAQKRSIEEARAPRRNKCGILAFVSNFEKFSDTTETIFKSSERRSDLEKWYTSLVMEMVNTFIYSFILNFIYWLKVRKFQNEYQYSFWNFLTFRIILWSLVSNNKFWFCHFRRNVFLDNMTNWVFLLPILVN